MTSEFHPEPELIGHTGPEARAALEALGAAWVSTTRLRGRTYLRAGIVNYLSQEADVDRMLQALLRLGPGVRGTL